MKVFLALALAASLSACAFGARPATEAGIARAADRAVRAETTYADGAEFATVIAPALTPAHAATAAEFDRGSFIALRAARLTYPPMSTLSLVDRPRLDAAMARSDQAHDALQAALAADRKLSAGGVGELRASRIGEEPRSIRGGPVDPSQ